ncbi:MAG: PAS domain-containing protein, partial [Phycisphaerales bacterium]|nr:PAS domain-containing protein [Phycisphaerales bacterium]
RLWSAFGTGIPFFSIVLTVGLIGVLARRRAVPPADRVPARPSSEGLTTVDAIDRSARTPESSNGDTTVKAREADEHIIVLERMLADCKKELRIALRESPDLVFRMSSDAVYVDFYGHDSDGAIAPPSEFLGRHVAEVLPADVATKIESGIQAALSTRHHQTTEFTLRKSGIDCVYRARIIPLPSGEVLIFSHDETLAHDARLAAAHARDLLREVSRSMPGMAYRYRRTTEGVQSFDFVSDGSIELFGLMPEDIYADFQLLWNRILPEDIEPLVATIDVSANTLKPWQADYRINKDGEVRWIRGRSIPRIPFDDGTIVWDGILMDVTAEKNWERQLRELELELAHATRLSTVGEMMAVLAHEVNQPLGAISYLTETFRQLVAADPMDAEALGEAVDQLDALTERAAAIVRRVRSFTGHQTLYPDLLDVNPIVTQTILLLEPEARRREITLRHEFDENLPKILADRVMLQQVLVNLVRNAFEAIGRGSGVDEQSVIITTATIDDVVEITVEDTGPGVTPARVAEIFEPFITSKEHGMGLGLSISQRLVAGMGGTLRLAPSARGAVFRVTLPVAKERRPAGE